jgi:hypothetical protein
LTTQQLPISSYAVGRQPSQPRKNAERIFFGGMAMLLCFVVFIGFFPTFFGAGFLRAPLPNTVLRVHGIVFTAWMLLLVTQAALVPTGRIGWHRALGTVAFGLPPLMIALGVIAAVDALGRNVKIGPLDPATSLALPLVNIAAFAIVIAAAWRARRRPDAHKRLVVLATISLSTAALGRIPWTQLHLSPAAGPVIGLAALVLLLVAYDVLSLRRVHRSTMWAAPMVFAAGALAVPLGMTTGWHHFAQFVMRTAVPYV